MTWRSTYIIIPGFLALGMAMVIPTSPSPVVSEITPCTTPVPTEAKVHPLTADEVNNATTLIDKMMLDELNSHGQTLNPPIDDATFVRRAYLGIIGRIPTIDEIVAFDGIDGKGNKEKRKMLISALLDSPGRVHHEFTWWADLLRISTRLGMRYPGDAYIDWVKDQIRANTHYDQVVRQLITAEGPTLARGNGATGYYMRDAGMPLDNMANSVQVFLGTRVQCAQCHDHPFDKWTRKEFFELAAYTNSVHLHEMTKDLSDYSVLRKQAKDEKLLLPGVFDTLRMFEKTVLISVEGGKKQSIALPHDYQYPDAKPDELVQAKSLFEPSAPVGKGESAKVAYAQWLSSPDNPRFNVVIANRLWKRAFGAGLIEPVDNFTDTTVASNPALMSFLSKLMFSLDYDLKRFNQIIYLTEAWQRAVSAPEPAGSETYRFPGPLLQRMTSEQLWDSLLTLSVPDLDGRSGSSAQRLYKLYEETKGKNAKELFDLAVKIGFRSQQQRELEGKVHDVRAQLDATVSKDSPEARKLKVQLKELSEQREEILNEDDPDRIVKRKRYAPGQNEFVRADELPSPAPPGHILRIFGQSDRETIEAANGNPATTQALTMLNGFIDHDLLKEQSVLYQQMLKPKDMGGKVDMLFLAILGRQPTTSERELGKQEIARAMLAKRKVSRVGVGGDIAKEASQAALHNLAWVLLNGNEFLFVQ
jgi:Protein of unknown function (DUF1549)/Protein of unknown function (DUF1553)